MQEHGEAGRGAHRGAVPRSGLRRAAAGVRRRAGRGHVAADHPAAALGGGRGRAGGAGGGRGRGGGRPGGPADATVTAASGQAADAAGSGPGAGPEGAARAAAPEAAAPDAAARAAAGSPLAPRPRRPTAPRPCRHRSGRRGGPPIGTPLGPGTGECADRQDPALRALVDQALPEVVGAPRPRRRWSAGPAASAGVALEVGGGRARRSPTCRLAPVTEPPDGARAAPTASGGTVVVASRADRAGDAAPFADRLEPAVAYLAPRL